jgi:hypothetical protein
MIFASIENGKLFLNESQVSRVRQYGYGRNKSAVYYIAEHFLCQESGSEVIGCCER